MTVSKMAGSLIGSEIIKIAWEVNDMIKKGNKICNLTIGDFDPKIFPIPVELKDEISNAYEARQTNYPPANGLPELRDSVAAFIEKRQGLKYSVNDILVAGGSRPLIYATYLAIVDPGDKVVYPVPSWNNNHYCHLSGAKGVAVDTKPENDFMPTAAELAPHLKGATLLALCSPLNPTGTVFTKQALEDICDLVIEENKSRKEGEKPLYIMYDQIYWMLTFGGRKHYDPVNLRPELMDYVIYIDGISKCFAATGVRVGYSFGPAKIIDMMKAILGHIGAWAPKAEQLATSKYLNQEENVNRYIESFGGQIQKSLMALYDGLKEMKSNGYKVDAISPQGAIYLTAQFDIIGKKTGEGKVLNNNKEVTSYLISEAGLAIVPFGAFGTSDQSTWFRMSVGGASIKDIQDGLPRLKAALDNLN
jgi:aspartate aminotransferase